MRASTRSRPHARHMYVTRHSQVADRALRDSLWALYRRAYAPVAADSPTHEMLDRDEFDGQLLEQTNRVWVAWDDRMPVAMTLVSTSVRATRWLSEEYFERHYPERHRAGQVHYVVWVVVDPDADPHGANLLLARQALAVEAKEGALLVFDVPETHEPGSDGVGRAAELMLRMARLVGTVDLLPLTTQRYYALDFTRAARDHTTETRIPARR